MFSVSSNWLPEMDAGALTCAEVLGEFVDTSCMSCEDYDQLLKTLDRLEDFNGSQHPDNMYERIQCEVYPLPDTGDPSPPSVIVWAYEYCVPLPRTSAFRVVAQGNWPVLMRSESRQGAGPDWQDA